MTPTEQIDQWIAEHGSARDALNVALARLAQSQKGIEKAANDIRKNANCVPESNCVECEQYHRIAAELLAVLSGATTKGGGLSKPKDGDR